jgi:hypothetical protein
MVFDFDLCFLRSELLVCPMYRYASRSIFLNVGRDLRVKFNRKSRFTRKAVFLHGTLLCDPGARSGQNVGPPYKLNQLDRALPVV